MIGQKGSALTQVLLAVGVTTTLAAVSLKMFKGQNLMVNKVLRKSQLEQISLETKVMLTIPETCQATLGGKNFDSTDIEVIYSNNGQDYTKLSPGAILGSKGLFLTDISLANPNNITANNSGLATLILSFEKRDSKAVTTSLEELNINVTLDSSGDIASCSGVVNNTNHSEVSDSVEKLCLDIGGAYNSSTQACSRSLLQKNDVCGFIGKSLNSGETSCI